MTSAGAQLGAIIGGIAKEQESLKTNIAPDEADSEFLLGPTEAFVITGHITLTKLLYPTDSFILDHPVYGDVDSAVLNLDGGYAAGSPPTFPLTFPVAFSTAASLIYETSF